ncbi:conserved Plasmodium protein, unknown function [Plasmodium berghei]|uniref:Uncharacterized protein n=2 Tax=Plasmodium berghei TaxID=5821 RepID=A0A509ASN4_PLABA|nr:conserved Plasmodium protein, unknown function [Plasmodium berghei ANKA]CXJ29938.1 conserved Plasmodium protein, unknown function [Plasmodium berghei]SCM27100.1 conserved Plasmodium protein, unknown function [Plasmodium berghei]SCN28826.1 conserved Plasmodium protein, unknown function [Plasmodium berghei]SCO63133.1 conserved Plasmodium protein, unknown function [Plasmodium berghei]SCO64573.1 conserved Plasmodium protein, unknown function [Plasmodium berghei]|eukprot:XP_034424472.1 conserved Plasmodium protein, unknown function [Plasmodium berghei ANKA]
MKGNKMMDENKMKRKKNDNKIRKIEDDDKNEKKDTFNPQLSTRELKKIQYYENMFKKIEQQKEENNNELDNKNKKIHNNIKKNKKEYNEKKDEYIGSKKVDNKIEKYSKHGLLKKGKDNNNNDICKINKKIKKKKRLMGNYKGIYETDSNSYNSDNNEIYLKNEDYGNTKKNKISKSNIFEKKKLKKQKNEDNFNYSLFSSDDNSEKKENVLNSNSSIINEKNIQHINNIHNFNEIDKNINRTEYNYGGTYKIIEIKKRKKNSRKRNTILKIHYERGYVSDISFDQMDDNGILDNKTMIKNEDNNLINLLRFKIYNNIFLKKQNKNIVKRKRSFSVNSSLNEYFLESDMINLKNANDCSSTDSNFFDDENKINLLSNFEDTRKENLFEFLKKTSDKMNEYKWIKSMKMNPELSYLNCIPEYEKGNISSRINSSVKSAIKYKNNLNLFLKGKEDSYENINTKSNSMNYIDDENDTNKISLYNNKNYDECNTVKFVNKEYDVNFCMKKYLNDMKYINLKKFKKIKKGNLNSYLKGCTQILNTDKIDNLIFVLRTFTSVIEKGEEKMEYKNMMNLLK